MTHGIEPRSCGYHLRLRYRELRVEDGSLKCRLGIAARHLAMTLVIADQGIRLGFAAGAGCGWDRDHREHRFLRFAVAPVILHAAAVSEKKIDGLCAIERTSSPQADDKIGAACAGGVHASDSHLGSWVFTEVMEAFDL